MKVIHVITGSRAEYGQLRPLLRKILARGHCDLRLIVTGSHLEESQGNTQCEIENDSIPIFARIPISVPGDTKSDMSIALGHGIVKFSTFFSENIPDLLIVIGDRFETYSAAVSAAVQNIPIAHICGGSVTEGAVDDFFRHSITKMSYLHFVTCDQYRNRVIQLGEEPERVFNVGSLAIENIAHLELLTREELARNLAFDLHKPYCVVTYHPETSANQDVGSQLKELFLALEKNPQYRYIITLANADAGSRMINEMWTSEALSHSEWLVVHSLGILRYLSALKHAKMMIGNSSSGTTEGPAMHIPVINIGNRQKGRVMADCILNCDPVASKISEAMNRADTQELKKIAILSKNPFGDGNTSDRIVDIIDKFLEFPLNELRKGFYDIERNE